MAEKKKSTSTARQRGNKGVPAASPVVTTTSNTAVAAPVVAPVVAAPAPVVAAPVVAAPVALPGLEVDERPMIHMPAPPREWAQPVGHDAIARRAHEIHNTRGGTAFDNWIEAERELGAR